MSDADELAEMRAEVTALREEVARLREVPWWQQHGGGIAYGWQNACAGAAPVPQSYIVNTTCAAPPVLPADSISWYAPAAGAAGGVLPQVIYPGTAG